MENLCTMTKDLVSSWLTDTLNRQAFDFFGNIVEVFGAEANITAKPKIIASVHFYESSIPEVLNIHRYAELKALIPKNSSATKYPDIVQFVVDKGLPVADIDKSTLKDPSRAVEFVRETVGEGPFYISDHGGYFAVAAERLCQEFERSVFYGFTEYTHNGHVKYTEHAKNVDRPIISVAELGLKSPADREAGETVAHIVDHKLRQTTGLKVTNTRDLVQIGIIGYGRLGESAAEALTGRNVKEIWIAEQDVQKLLKAARKELVPKSIEEICRGCNVIISATGNAALKPHHFDMMGNDVFLATVTSPDDELDKDRLLREGVLVFEATQNEITTYKIRGTERRLHLIADGESANSLCKSGIGDPSLYLPQAAQIVANLYLEKFHTVLSPGLQQLPLSLENRVSLEWLKHFHHYNTEKPLSTNPWEELGLTLPS